MISHEDNNFESNRVSFDFPDKVQKIFQFLKDLGFTVLEYSPTIVRYRKQNIEINIYHGRSSYEIGLEIGKGETKYAISEIIRITDPELAREYKNYIAASPKSVIEGLNQLANLIKQYGQFALHGDADFYDVMKHQRELRKHEFALDVLEGQLRPKVDEAFKLGKYREAAELLEKIAPRLTKADLRKLEIARKRGKKQN